VTAIGYVRRSKESTERTVSLEDQRARIAAYCAERGWALSEVLADDGVSGGNRERLERLAERVKATEAGVVVVYNLDRFARDVSALLDALRAYARSGVELHVVGRGKVDVASASGFLVTGVEGLMAEHYRRLIGEKTRDALERRRLQGRRYSRVPPYGFSVTPDGRLEPEPYEQSVLGMIAALVPEGLSLRALSRVLAGRGALARTGRPFEAKTLSRVLRAVADRSVSHSLVS
jgi:DNA invertase Pin-like site-specific DNA recombinase